MKQNLIKTHLEYILSRYFLPHNSSALDIYSDVFHFKNDYIKSLFKDSEDGRIIIRSEDFASLTPEFLAGPSSTEISNFVNNGVRQIAYNTNLDGYTVSNLISGFSSVLISEFLNKDSKKIGDANGLLNSIKGMKIGKVLNTLLDFNILTAANNNLDFSKKDIDYIRNTIIGGKISSFINSNAGDTYANRSLVISINPVDFLTMSCGTSWSSCMTPDGGYSSGTLPYATGKDTLIVYLMNTGDEEDLNDPKRIVDKIWRQIAYLSEDKLVVMQKSYPDRNDYLSVLSSVIIGKEANLNLCIDSISKSNINEEIILFNKGLSCGYVDLDHGCTPEFVFGPKEIVSESEYKISAQEVAYCLQCGTNHYYLSDSFGLCDDCGGNEICENCDCRFNIGSEGGITVDDWTVCGDCLDHYYVYSNCEYGFILESDSTLFAYKNSYNGRFDLDYAYSSDNGIVYKNEIEDFDIEVASKITNVFHILEDDLEFCEETGTYFVNIDNIPDDSEEE